VSYSQGDEEKYILQAVANISREHGRFLDIGAWHAVHLSNTRALFEQGWSGVLIDPSPEPFMGLLREYGMEDRVQLVCAAVGLSRSIERFHATADALTTSNRINYERWKSLGGFYGSFYTPMITIPEILTQFGDFDFVNIDAEGASVDLFHALLATEMRPAAICVEYDFGAQQCMDAADKKGYRMLYSSSENLVFGR
jgi:FkbM family methyltransferase